ncbi:hypothetical protein HY029_03355 [Candidatus Gottesmanbacteria bacterium]|nr:hypothetical protein [Candidatus Gottesmanbacteria bacterium]
MIQKIKKWFSTENLIIAAVIFVAIFFTKFPTLYHWLNTPKGYWYPKNTSWFDAWDINVYVSYIRYGQKAGVFLENTYTTVPHPKEFIYQYYTFLGVFNRFLHLDPFVLFHLASIATSIVLILVTYYVIKIFIEDNTLRIAAFIISILGGGFGWISYLQGADIWNAGFTTVNAFERGHDALGTVFLLLSMVNIYLFTATRSTKYLLYGIFSSLGSIAINPTFIILYLPVSLAATFSAENNKQRMKSLIYPISLAVMFSIYYLLFLAHLSTNPGFANIGQTNLGIINSFSLISGFGFLSIFLMWTLMSNYKNNNKIIFVNFFFLSQLFFVYFPVDFNLYFIKGLYLWGVILASYGLNTLITNKKILNVTSTVLVLTAILTRVYIFNSLMNAETQNPFFYLTKPEGEAISYMAKLPSDKAVLSLYRVGNYIPAHTDNIVYYGHKHQTPNGETTLRMSQLFYTSLNEEQQRKFLSDNHIDYIYYGIEEAQLRKNNKLEISTPFPYFPIVFSNDSVIVFGTGKSEIK